MKTLATLIVTVLFPILAMAQEQKFPSTELQTLDGITVSLEYVIQDNNLTILYFFNENSRNLTEQFDYLENLAEEFSNTKLKVIAIYNASGNSSYRQIKPFMSGYNIGIETFIDVNGKLQRELGLPFNSTIILTRDNGYAQFVSFTPEQAASELLLRSSGDSNNSYCDLCHFNTLTGE